MNSGGIIVDIKIRSNGVDCQLNGRKPKERRKNYLDHLLIVFFLQITKLNFIYVVRVYREDFNVYLEVTSTQNFIFMSTNFWSNCFNVFLLLLMEKGQWTMLCAFEMRMKQSFSYYISLFGCCIGVIGYNEMINSWLLAYGYVPLSSECIDHIVINDPKTYAGWLMVNIFSLLVELETVRVHVKLNSNPLIESWLRTTNNTQSHDNNH